MESGLERIVKLQVRAAIRQLIKQLRTVSLLAGPTLKMREVREIAKLLRDTNLIADRADQLWPDTVDGGTVKNRRNTNPKKETGDEA